MVCWFDSMSGLFGVFELFRGASVFVCSCSAGPLLSVFSLVVFFTDSLVTVDAGGIGPIESVAEHAVAASPGYFVSG